MARGTPLVRKALSLVSLLSFGACSRDSAYLVSNHWDGSRFHNAVSSPRHGFWAVLRMLTRSRFEEWPDQIQNLPYQAPQDRLREDQIRVSFVNHATLLVETDRFTFLTDPVWSVRVSPFRWIGPKRHREPGIPFTQLPPIDFVMISHNHYDHMDLATLRRLNDAHHPQFFVPLGNRIFLENNGMKRVTELDWWQSAEVGSGLRVTLTPAKHFSGRGLFDRNQTLWGSYVVTYDDRRIYFGGDTAYSPHFGEIRARCGPPDLAILPIGAYDPRWFMQGVHVNPAEALAAHLDLGSKQSIGMHFGTFRLTTEKIEQPLVDLKRALQEKQIPLERFVTLAEGQPRVFQLESRVQYRP